MVLYEMVTGSQPFDGPTTPMIFDALLNKTPDSVRERNPKVPAELERIIGKLLEKDRALRYPSAVELHHDRERLQKDLNSGAIRPGKESTSGKPAEHQPSIAVLPFANMAATPMTNISPTASRKKP